MNTDPKVVKWEFKGAGFQDKNYSENHYSKPISLKSIITFCQNGLQKHSGIKLTRWLEVYKEVAMRRWVLGI